MPLERQSWDSTERRQRDAGSGVTSLKIATRAAEGIPFDAERMFQGSGSLDQGNVRPADRRDLKLRSKVEALLRIAVIDDVEIAKFVDGLVDAQYQGSLNTLKLGEEPLYDPERPVEGDVTAPTPEQAKAILADQVMPEEFEIIQRMEKPTLQLIPVTSMARYLKALNSHKPMDGQNDAYVSDWHQEAFVRADNRDGVKNNNTIVGWRIAVTECSKEPKLLDGDDVSKTLREREAWFKQEFQRRGVSGVDFKRMLALIMDALKNGIPINEYLGQDGTWTFVNEEPEENGNVSGVGWDNAGHQVRLADGGADRRCDDARFRASVVVDVPKTA